MDFDKPEVVLRVVAALEQLGITYLICGSFASALYGLARSTNDADLVAEVKPDQVSDLFRALDPDFYVNETSIKRAVEMGRQFNVIHSETQFKVDIFTPKPGGFAAKELARRQEREFGTASRRTAFFASAEDTVVSKLEWYRRGNEVSDLQWRDVVTVLKVQRDRLDIEYLRQSAAELGVLDLLEEALTEAATLWES
jgi:hypothetical protein